MSEQPFLEQVLQGDAFMSDIDDFVAQWHEGAGAGQLHEYLGMTWDEYRLWTERPESRRLIVAARQRDEPLESLLSEVDMHAIAARGLSERDARAVREWLEKTGRLPSR